MAPLGNDDGDRRDTCYISLVSDDSIIKYPVHRGTSPMCMMRPICFVHRTEKGLIMIQNCRQFQSAMVFPILSQAACNVR